MEGFFVFLALLIALYANNKANKLERRLHELEKGFKALQDQLAALYTSKEAGKDTPNPSFSTPLTPITPITPNKPDKSDIPAKSVIPAMPIIRTAPTTPTTLTTPRPNKPPPPQSPTPPPAPPPAWLLAVKEWLFGGNLVAKIGLLILFIGVGFLIKYAAARVTIPIELRLAAVVLADIALLLWAWRIRLQRPGISLPVQGTALSILMMVTFAAFRLYELIPSGMAFVLLFLLTAFTCLLAVLQNALWLAIFGITGGFAVPILTANGSGNHIGLFSYYALLNAGVFGIALFRSWRSLNLIGFGFTFLIGTLWGILKYTPENYASAQFFLILFFLFYLAIGIVYASKEAPKLKHYVDATLVFGTPMLAFGLQYHLVKSWPFGVAYACLALGLLYIGLALALWRKRGGSLRLLVESYLALGLVFATLALPFALDARWTSAAWALEGAGILWIGLRQQQTRVWAFGLLVQAAAWLSFLSSLARHSTAQTNLWLGFLLLAGTAFLVATAFRSQDKAQRNPRFTRFASVFLAGATIWLVAGAWVEIFRHTDGGTQASLIVLSGLLIALGLLFLSQRMQWRIALHFALALQILAGLSLLLLTLGTMGPLHWTGHGSTNLLDGPFLGALMIGAASFFSARACHQQLQAPNPAPSSLHHATQLRILSKVLLAWAGFWWFAHILHSLAGWLEVHYQIATGRDGQDLYGYSILLALTTPWLAKLAQRWAWPALRWAIVPTWLALALATLLMLVELIPGKTLPKREQWCAFIALWLASEWLMQRWQKNNWSIAAFWLKCWHFIRSGGPWLMIWPVGAWWIERWLSPTNTREQALLQQADWISSGSWARYIPAWLMMGAIFWLARQIRTHRWPVPPLATWYQARILPLVTACSLLLVAFWNLTQDGTMQPLPYLPLLNPLDLSTAFACLLALLALNSYRLLPATTKTKNHPLSMLSMRVILPLYAWFNLILLRTAAHVWDIPYHIDTLFASNKVQAMLSLTWAISALVLMRFAAKNALRKQWIWGAILLAMVVAKLFLVDQTNGGSVERIIAFVGVGLLMLVIGYLAPFPKTGKETNHADRTDHA